MPVCKGCGGSFDDNFRFCPYCGRAKPESEVIKVEVSVSSNEKWETCKIHQAIYAETNDGLNNVEEGYFWADGIGPNGTFFAGKSPIFKTLYGKNKENNNKWERGSDGSALAHNFLVNQLIKNGWESDGSIGENWWQNQFRRRYGKEYPPSWTVWEIHLERSGFLDTTGYFVIQSSPSGNKRQPVKRGKSREFKAGFEKPCWENPERRKILEEFLTELQSQGYKLLPSSENKSLKDCSHSWSHWTSVWYFQILIKEKQQ